MGAISGIAGAVDGISTMRQWSVSSTADLQQAIASNTKGAPIVLAGNKDWSGNYQAYGHTPLKLPGDVFTFTGSIDGTNGATGSALVASVEITIDIEAGAIIAHTVNFESNGALTFGAAAASDTSGLTTYSSIGCKIETAEAIATPAWTELPDIRTITITLTKNNPSYASSSTAGNTQREEGNLTGTLALTCYTDDFSSLPRENDVRAVRVYVNATEFWLFNWIRFGEASDLSVNREEASIVPASLNGQFTGWTDVAGTITEGKINKPDLTTYWPAA